MIRQWRVTPAERVSIVFVVLAALAFYALHWYPGPGGRIWYGDSVSFQFYATSHSLGHSPGYPQYLALVRTLARIPLGQVWQRVNFVSSLFGALALGAHYVLCRNLGLRALEAWAAVVVLGLSRTEFTEATEAEVYTLNLCWVLACLALFVWYLNARRPGILFAFFLVFGLSLGHHPTMVLLVVPVLITVICHDRRLLLDWRVYAAAAMAILLGALQYLYTYRLFVDSTLSYRWVDYPEHSLRNFIDFTTGSKFRRLLFAQPISVTWREKVPRILEIAHAQNTILLPMLGMCGLAATQRITSANRTLLLLCIAAYAAWAVGYNVSDIEAFCTPLWALCYIAVVPGFEALTMRYAARSSALIVIGLSLLAFRYSVVETGVYRPENDRLIVAKEYIANVPAGAELVPFMLDDNSALPALFRYLAASGDSGPIRVANSVKRCVNGLYFTDGSRKLMRVRGFRERQVGHLERSNQNLYVMECDHPHG
jgi:hypothetical protein